MTPDRVCSADNRHRSLLTVFDQTPDTAVDAFIAPTAAVVGRVNIQDRSSVGYGCVLRGARAPPPDRSATTPAQCRLRPAGDTNYIHVGAYSHILDGTRSAAPFPRAHTEAEPVWRACAASR